MAAASSERDGSGTVHLVISRRVLLVQFGLGAAAVAVAGCGGRGTTSAPSSSAPAGPASAPDADPPLAGVAFDVRTEPG